MFYILATFITIFLQAFAYDLDKLIEDAEIEVSQEESKIYFKKAVNAIRNKDYITAIKSAEKFLEKNRISKLEKEIAYEILGISYFVLGTRPVVKQKAMPYVKKMDNLLRKIYYQPLSKDTKLKLFVLANNLFLKTKEEKRRKILNENYSFLKRKKYFVIENPEYDMFEPYINIFPIEKGNLFGTNQIYISEKNQTLIEIAKLLDMGYDELRIANKYVNPNDIKKGEAIFVPRKRLIPEKDFEFYHIYINLSEKRLYYPVMINNKPYVITIPVGIGTDENQSPVGDFKITEKRRNPEWRVPKSIREENPDLPEVVPPGPDNPLGTRAMRLGNTSFLMHGTSKKFGIGMKVSHGCIRMYNRDVERLFDIVPKGTPVHITEKDYKLYKNKTVLIEVFSLSQKDKKEITKEFPDINKDILDYTEKERKGYATPLK
jgi:lipoprotein-anchoring transpeptidase ErfK/SrfK